MYLTLAATLLYPTWRPLDKARMELLWLGCASFLLLPLVNALTTDRGLVASIQQGDWLMAGFDMSALLSGMLFAAAALKVQKRQSRAQPAGPEADDENQVLATS